MKKILLFMLGVLLALPGIARDFTYEYEGQTLTYTVLDEKAKTCKTKDGSKDYWNIYYGNIVENDLIIPEIAKDGDVEYSVVELGDYAFAGCSSLASVTIPGSVISIGQYAFSECTSLASMTIGNSVKEIGDYAFAKCSSLTSATIPDSVISIGKYVFSNCNRLQSVTIGNSINAISEYAFQNCFSLTSVTFGNSVKSIDMYAFGFCKALKSLIIPDTVTTIGWYAFQNCSNLTSVTIGNSVNVIGSCAFNNCSGLTSLTFSNSVKGIGGEAFMGCKSLTSLTIPDSVTKIGESAFKDCSGLTSVTIGNSINDVDNPVNVIGKEAFSGCSRLTSVTIGNSVKEIGESAFTGCSNLTSLSLGNSVKEIGVSAFSGCNGLTSLTIGNSINKIGYGAFYRCKGLTSVTFGNTVKEIGDRAFEDCYALESIVTTNMIPPTISADSFKGEYVSTVLSVPEDAATEYIATAWSLFENIQKGDSEETFKTYETGNLKYRLIPSKIEGGKNLAVVMSGDYSSLTEVTIPERFTVSENGTTSRYYVDAVGYNAFNGCGNIKTITFNSRNATRVIGEYAFADTKISQIVLPETVEIIGKHAFSRASLTDITLPKSVITIDDAAFNYCTELTSAILGPAVKNIGNSAFYWCRLKNITIPGCVETIGDNAFEGCPITDLILEPGIKSIGNEAFKYCSHMQTVTIPGSVETIGDYAFRECSRLNTVVLEPGIKTIGEHAFWECSYLGNITIPGSVETISPYTFYECSRLSTIVLEPGVKAIEEYAFSECTNVTSVTIPGSVKTIGDYAFYNINTATDLLKNPIEKAKIILNEGLESIGRNAFYLKSGRQESPLYIPSTLTSIGKDAFRGFAPEHVDISDLEAWFNIDFENSIANPANGNSLYLNGEQIKDLVIPESVTEVKKYAFCNVALESLTCNNALQSINTAAFYNCGFNRVVIPGNVRTIGPNALHSDIPYHPELNLKDITFAYGAEPIAIDLNGFPKPTKLSCDRPIESLNFDLTQVEDLTLGNSVTEIPAARFKDFTKLSTVTLGNGLTTIGDEAFSGCTGLTEVILPPSTETIGASAFAGNTKLTSIIMGHKVKTIGEKAYDLCPAQTVSITAQTPPEAPDNTFSNYTGSLYVQGEEAAEAYYNADYCWFQFEGHVMIEPTELKVDGDKTLTGKAGDTFQLTATLYPEKVTLPQIFWRSTNPDIATVTPDGLVTLHADMSDIMAMAADDDSSENSCKIIAETLYANGPVAEITVNSISSGIDNIIDTNTPDEIDYTAPVEVYNFQGMKVATTTDNLSAGIYIIRQGNIVKKIAVK